MSASQRKLAEAKFFLLQLEKQTLSPAESSEAFRYYLSAFLSAAWSVVDSLRHGKKDKFFEDMLSRWKGTLAESDAHLFDFMTNQRHAEVHRLGTDFEREIKLVPISGVDFLRMGGGPHVAILQGGEAPVPEIAAMVAQFQIDGEQLEVVAACNKYLELLGSLISFANQEEGKKAEP